MKRFILLAALLWTAQLRADTISTGTVYFTLPSTNTQQPGKSWGTKNNENWQSAATALGLLQSRQFVISAYDNSNVFLGNFTTLKLGTNLTPSLSGSTLTVSASASGGGGTVTESTSVVTLTGGGVFLSTSGPIGSTTFRLSKGTFSACGVDAFINKPSSVAATMFKVWFSTSANYGISWSTITPQIVVDTNTRQAVYISTGFVICDGCWVSVGIDTIATSGLQAEDWGVNIYGIMRRDFQKW